MSFFSPLVERLEDRRLLATYNVTGFADGLGVITGTGPFDATTLRGAIIAANANAGPDTINLPASLPDNPYTLSIDGRLENSAATGDLDVTGPLTISGAGANVTTINANGIDRVFHLPSGSSLNLSGVTVIGGVATDDGFSPGTGQGGGLLSSFVGTITISDSVFSGNRAEGSAGGSGQGGGSMLMRRPSSWSTA